jgi:hypothetical protein
MLDRRNDFERSFDAKLFLAISALMTMPILWLTKTQLGVGQYVLDFGISIILLFGLYLLTLLSVPALVFLGVLIVRKLRSAPRSCSAFIENQARK